MKRIMVCLLMAVLLASVLVVVPASKTAHADGDECSNYNGVSYQVDKNYNTLYYYEFNSANADVWPCISIYGNNAYVWTDVSFRRKPIYKTDEFGINLGPICKITIALQNIDNGDTRSNEVDCSDDYWNNRIGVSYNLGNSTVYSGRWQVFTNINIWYYDAWNIHLETGNQRSSTIYV